MKKISIIFTLVILITFYGDVHAEPIQPSDIVAKVLFVATSREHREIMRITTGGEVVINKTMTLREAKELIKTLAKRLYQASFSIRQVVDNK